MPKVERDGLSDAPPMPHLGRDAPPGAWPRFSDAPGGARVRGRVKPRLGPNGGTVRGPLYTSHIRNMI